VAGYQKLVAQISTKNSK